jgi:hypothetical protein
VAGARKFKVSLLLFACRFISFINHREGAALWFGLPGAFSALMVMGVGNSFATLRASFPEQQGNFLCKIA